MAIKKILVWPHATLSSASLAVEKVDENIRSLIRDMLETMHAVEEGAAGLAAPQIGILLRIFLADIPPDRNDGEGTNGPEAFINPEIIAREGEFEWEEGCLSIPGLSGKVKRSEHITLKYLDIHGNEIIRKAHGYLSGCFQHELDHLNGVLWISYQSRLAQDIVRRKMKKYKARMTFDGDE